MVKHEIMRLNTFESIQDRVRLIEKEYFETFVVSILTWYQQQVSNPTSKDFYDKRVIEFNQPPNLFDLFEYPNIEAEAVINQFVLSDASYRLSEDPDLGYLAAKDAAVLALNNLWPDIYETMLHDVHQVLDAYHLFFIYQDDSAYMGSYFNPYVKEIW